ncbi:MAG: cation efflux family-domain-containing protein [Benjaminiella poitrasii]|nr:MAG: cation efflux family-domain-containing protein [Benjaminiella poitrasii]
MHQTRQFTKRRPQSPLLQQQQQAIDGLKIAANKSRSGLAVQSNAPIHSTRSFNTKKDEQEHSHQHLSVDHHHSQPISFDPYQPSHNHVNENNHTHHDRDNHHHDHEHDHHHHHDHIHNHDNHHHDNHHGNHHHDDNHQHDHHDHHHGHTHTNFSQVYTQPLPSYSSIFATLIPSQKALFTCFLGHMLTGMIVWWLGVVHESLATVGFSYLVLFDAFGTLNVFVSSVLHLNPAFTMICTKRPFGVKRFEIIFALANTVFLLFGTMYTTKETLEHALLEEHHAGDHHTVDSSFPLGLLTMVLVAIGASFATSVGFSNHENLVHLMKKSPYIQPSHYDLKSLSTIDKNTINAVLRNTYSSSIIGTGSLLFFTQIVGLSPTIDKCVAFLEAGLMLYLGVTTATALAKVLLQTMPDTITSHIDHSVRLVQQQVPNVISVDKIHFWQNAYGKCIGTVEIQVRPEADEDAVISAAFDILEPLVRENNGELTISVKKRH